MALNPGHIVAGVCFFEALGARHILLFELCRICCVLCGFGW